MGEVNHTKMLIACENQNDGSYPLMVLVTDPHGKHVMGHLKAIWRFRVLKHVVEHLVLWRRQRIAGLPSIEINTDSNRTGMWCRMCGGACDLENCGMEQP